MYPWCYVFERSLVVPCFSLSCFSPSSTSSLPHSTCSLPGTPSSMSTPPRVKNTALRSIAPHRKTILSQVMSPSSSTTSTSQRLLQWPSRMNPATWILVRCGTRRWDYRKSAIFTTVHSWARRTSEPKTNLSLSWRKFAASSAPFHMHKYCETRFRTKFRFVLKTKIKSRNGKQKNQDSPWKTKRASSRLSQNHRDPEAWISSRFW